MAAVLDEQCYLKALAVKHAVLSPSFAANRFHYDLMVPRAADVVTLVPTAGQAHARVTVNMKDCNGAMDINLHEMRTLCHVDGECEFPLHVTVLSPAPASPVTYVLLVKMASAHSRMSETSDVQRLLSPEGTPAGEGKRASGSEPSLLVHTAQDARPKRRVNILLPRPQRLAPLAPPSPDSPSTPPGQGGWLLKRFFSGQYRRVHCTATRRASHLFYCVLWMCSSVK